MAKGKPIKEIKDAVYRKDVMTPEELRQFYEKGSGRTEVTDSPIDWGLLSVMGFGQPLIKIGKRLMAQEGLASVVGIYPAVAGGALEMMPVIGGIAKAFNIQTENNNIEEYRKRIEAEDQQNPFKSVKPMFANGGIVKPKNKYVSAEEKPIDEFPYNGTSFMYDDKDYNLSRALELYNPDRTGHLPSVDNTTGEWLKGRNYPTSWMEFLNSQLNLSLNKEVGFPTVNENGKLQYRKGYANGGTVMKNKNIPVELEGGEFFQTPEGQIGEVQGQSHEQGGVDMALPEGTQVFSDRVKIKGKTMAERKEARMNKMMKLLEKVSANPNAIAKNSFKRTMKAVAMEEEIDLAFQEVFNDLNNSQEYAYGTSGIRPKNRKYNLWNSPKYDWENSTMIYSRDPNKNAKILPYISGKKFDTVGTYDLGTNPLSVELHNAQDFLRQQIDPSLDNISYNDVVNNFGVVDIQVPNVQIPKLDFQTNQHYIFSEEGKAGNFVKKSSPDFQIPEVIKNPADRFNPLKKMIYGENPVYNIGEDFNMPNKPTPSSTIIKGGASLGVPVEEDDETDPLGLTTGDVVGMAGQAFGAISQIANTISNAKATKKNINHYLGFNEKALQSNAEELDNLNMSKANAVRALGRELAIGRNTARARTRGSATSINSLRNLDLATEIAANEANIAGANQIEQNYLGARGANIGQRTQLLSQKDAMEMQGAAAADLADRQDLDAIYTNFGANFADISTGIQSFGKNLNESRYRDLFLKILPQANKYGIGMDAQGNLTAPSYTQPSTPVSQAPAFDPLFDPEQYNPFTKKRTLNPFIG